MSIDELKYFLTISECGSFNKAASQLNISQQGISHSIKSLETDIGEALFVRTSKGVNLSEFGKAFLPYAQKVIEASDQLERFVESSRSKKKIVLRIGLRDGGNHSPLNSAMINTVDDFVQAKGNSILVEKYFEGQYDLMDKLKLGKIDVIQTIGPVEEDVFEVFPAIRSRLYVIAERSYGIKENSVFQMKDLKDYDMIFPVDGNPYCEYLKSLCRKAGFEPRVVSYEASAKTLTHSVYRGHGISFLPDQSSDAACKMYPGMCEYIIEPPIYFDYSLVILRDSPKRQLAKELIEYVVENAERNVIPNLI